jgi:hypothetical protein
MLTENQLRVTLKSLGQCLTSDRALYVTFIVTFP